MGVEIPDFLVVAEYEFCKSVLLQVLTLDMLVAENNCEW